jgi:hypothetical protein
MLQVDHVYEFLYQELFKDFDFYHLFNGVTSNKNMPAADISIFTRSIKVDKKIFFYDQEPFISSIANPYIDRFTWESRYTIDELLDKNKNNDAVEFFELLKEQISPLKNYDLYEYNSGIGNYTMIFGKFFKNVSVFESDLLHFQITKINVSLYNDNKIENINFNNNLILTKINKANTILFINYQLKSEPKIKEIKIFFDGLIIILSPNIIENINIYYDNYFRYKLENNYIYFINFY